MKTRAYTFNTPNGILTLNANNSTEAYQAIQILFYQQNCHLLIDVPIKYNPFLLNHFHQKRDIIKV